MAEEGAVLNHLLLHHPLLHDNRLHKSVRRELPVKSVLVRLRPSLVGSWVETLIPTSAARRFWEVNYASST
jgi:hypothetical protein